MLYKSKTLVPLMFLVGAETVCATVTSGNTNLLEEVIVTANKVHQSLQATSTPITVVSATDIRNKSIEDIDDITKILPNSSNGSVYSGTTDWNYRGLNSSVFLGNNPVVIYVDGIAQLDRRIMSVNMRNIERIEIIRGPSGTVHGKDAIGGVVDVTTKPLSEEFSSDLFLELGEHGKQNMNLSLSGSVTEGIQGKLVVERHNYDGDLPYQDKTVSSENDDKKSGRKLTGELAFALTDSSLLRIQANYDEEETGYGRNDLVTIETINSAPVSDRLDYNTKTKRDSKIGSQTILYRRQGAAFDLDTQISHRRGHYDGSYECDYGSLSEIVCTENMEVDDIDFEIRLASDQQSIKWVAGLYSGRYKKTVADNGYEFAGFPLAYSEGTHTHKTHALFGQIIYPLFDHVEITAGARYQRQTYDVDALYFAAANPTYGLPEVNSFVRGSESETAFLPKLGVSWLLNDNNTLFANVSRGVLGGGFNDFQESTSGAADAYFSPQFNNSLELGYRGRFDKFRMTVNLFLMDIEDIHTYTITAGSLYSAGNLKGATSKGVELEALYQLTEQWSADAVLGYTNAKYKDGSLFNGLDASNKKVEKTPESTVSLGVNYTREPWDARLDAQYRGDYYYNFQNDKKVDGFVQWNMRVAWHRDDLELFLFIQNLTDEDGVAAVFDTASLSGPGTVSRAFINPRTASIGLNYHF